MILKIKTLLEKAGIKVAYGKFKEKTDLPYAIIIGDGQDKVLADNKIYLKKNAYRVELYSLQKEFELEDKIENIFIQNGIIYDKSADVIIEEDIYSVFYFIRGQYNGK